MPEVAPTARRPAPPLTPPIALERARLAQAIAAYREGEAALARIAEARSRAPDPVDAMLGVDKATEALAKARAGEARATVTALLNGGVAQNNDMALADRALRQATVLYDRAKKVQVLLNAEERGAEQQLALRRAWLEEAVGAALRAAPEVMELCEAYRAAEARFWELRACMLVVGVASGIPAEYKNWQTAPAFGPLSSPPDNNPDKLPAVAVWREAVADLADDAGAALPEV